MILIFHAPPLVSGQELCDIDSPEKKKSEKDIKKGSPGAGKLNRL